MSQNAHFPTMDEVLTAFGFHHVTQDCRPYGNGHINDTFLLTCAAQEDDDFAPSLSAGQGASAAPAKKYILQRMNHKIFQNPKALMENVANVTAYLRKVILDRGGDPERETLHVIQTARGENFYEDSLHNFWRVFLFIENAICLEQVERPKDFYDSAVAFGGFQRLLADYPAHTLHETIPRFHHTPSRFLALQKAVSEDAMGRAKLAQKEIAFAFERAAEASALTDLLAAGKLPLRVTHNDTKLNNILFDAATKKALCIIDLDTVMPGLSLYDFGDSIRFGASTGAEDETDLSKIELDLSLYQTFTEGFLTGSAGSLTDREIALLPMGAKLMTYECGIRFLADYLAGDVYFKIHREGHNLDRARTQFKLVADMERKWKEMSQ